MDKKELGKHYKFLDKWIEKNWDNLEFRIIFKEAEKNYFNNRNEHKEMLPFIDFCIYILIIWNTIMSY